MNCQRILIIGIDGGTFNFITPLLSAGKLPNFQRLISGGVAGNLESTLPPVCTTAWASFLTGKNPGKHGVFDFFEFKKNAYKKKVVDINSIRTSSIWQIFHQYRKKLILMNIPIMYPARPTNGVMVTGALTPPGAKCAYPESLSQELYRQQYLVDVAYEFIPKVEPFWERIQQMTAKRVEVFQQLLRKYSWDLALVNFVGVERLQQAVWERKDLIEAQYQEYDRILGELMSQLDENVSIMVMSDHGFTAVNRKFYVNEWLGDLGLLAREIKVGEPSIPEFMNVQFERWRDERVGVQEWLQNSGITSDKMRALIPTSIEMLLKKLSPLKARHVLPQEHLIIDWSNTYAYLSSRFSYAININLKGREPGGIVEPGQEYEEIRKFIVRELYRLKDPKTFQNVIDQVHLGEELFWGPHAAEAPDIVFIPQNYAYSIEPDKRLDKSVISNGEDLTNLHSAPDPNGIFMGYGPEFAKGRKLTQLKIWDLLPNILHLLDIPIPDDLDGVVRTDLFTDDSEFAHKEIDIEMQTDSYYDETDEPEYEPAFSQSGWAKWQK